MINLNFLINLKIVFLSKIKIIIKNLIINKFLKYLSHLDLIWLRQIKNKFLNFFILLLKYEKFI